MVGISAQVRAMRKQAALFNKVVVGMGSISTTKAKKMKDVFKQIKGIRTLQWVAMVGAFNQIEDFMNSLGQVGMFLTPLMSGFNVLMAKLGVGIFETTSPAVKDLLGTLTSEDMLSNVEYLGKEIGERLIPAFNLLSGAIEVSAGWIADIIKAYEDQDAAIDTLGNTLFDSEGKTTDFGKQWDDFYETSGLDLYNFLRDTKNNIDSLFEEGPLYEEGITEPFLPTLPDTGMAGGGIDWLGITPESLGATNINITITDSVIESRDELVNEIAEKIWQQMV